MKLRLFILLVCVAALFQGWASPVDSLTTKQSLWGIGLIDDSRLSDSYGFSGDDEFDHQVSISDLYTPYGATTNGYFDALKYIKVISATDNAKFDSKTKTLSFNNTYVGKEVTTTIVIETRNVAKFTLKLVDSNTATSMYTLGKTQVNVGSSKDVVETSVTITYTPSATGTHTVSVVLKEVRSIFETLFYVGASPYTLNVTGSATYEPSVTVTPQSLHFPAPGAKSFNVKGSYLTSNLKLRLSGSGEKYFSLSKTTISKSTAMSSNGASVTVTCNPKTTLQRAYAQVEILHNGVVLKTVGLSYVKGSDTQINPVEPEQDTEDMNQEESDENSPTPLYSANACSVEELADDVAIYSSGQDIIIETTMEQDALICDTCGRARNVKLCPGRNVIPINATGIHIVRVGNKTAKLLIR